MPHWGGGGGGKRLFTCNMYLILNCTFAYYAFFSSSIFFSYVFFDILPIFYSYIKIQMAHISLLSTNYPLFFFSSIIKENLALSNKRFFIISSNASYKVMKINKFTYYRTNIYTVSSLI